MNKVILSGRLTRDPEVRTTQSGINNAAFTVAVQRKYKDADGNYPADFINCVAWRSTSDFVGKYFKKGSAIIVVGSINTRTYEDKDGKKRYVTEVNTEEVEFGIKSDNEKTEAKAETKQSGLEDFQPVTLDEKELPF